MNDPTATTTDPYSYWMSHSAANWNGTGLHYSQDYGLGEADAQAARPVGRDMAGPADLRQSCAIGRRNADRRIAADLGLSGAEDQS